MTDTDQRCPGADNPEERCPRHPRECTCWKVDLNHPTVIREERALEAAWKACSAWDGKITKPVLRKAIAAYLKEIAQQPVQETP